MVYNIWKETHPQIHERNLKLNTEKIFFLLDWNHSKSRMINFMGKPTLRYCWQESNGCSNFKAICQYLTFSPTVLLLRIYLTDKYLYYLRWVQHSVPQRYKSFLLTEAPSSTGWPWGSRDWAAPRSCWVTEASCICGSSLPQIHSNRSHTN